MVEEALHKQDLVKGVVWTDAHSKACRGPRCHLGETQPGTRERMSLTHVVSVASTTPPREPSLDKTS